MQNQNHTRPNKPSEPDRDDRSYLKYTSLGFQLVITIGVFTWLGYKMDQWWNEGGILFTIIMLLLGIVGAFYNFFRSVSS